MKRYWQFLIVGDICLLVALLWAQPSRSHSSQSPTAAAAASQQSGGAPAAVSNPAVTAKKTAAEGGNGDDQPLPGSSSSLPLLAVIGFGVLAGGITSAMRSR